MIDREIFKKVALSEKKSLYRSMIQEKTQMLGKGEGDALFYFWGVQIQTPSGKWLQIQWAPDSEQATKSESIIVNFNFQNERYFLQTNFKIEADSVLMDIDQDLFVLQRRLSPRLSIPADYNNGFNITEFQNRTVFYSTQLLDFSVGGAKLLYPKAEPLFQMHDQFMGYLHIGQKKPTPVKAQVKYVAPKTGDATQQTMGIQFVELSSIQESHLTVIFMDLQRDLFLKLKK